MKRILTLLFVILIATNAYSQPQAMLAGIPVISNNATSGVSTGTAWATLTTSAFYTWQVSFSSPPSSSDTVVLQGSFDNSTWFTLDISTNTAGEIRNFTTSTPFVRTNVTAQTGGGNLTTTLIGKNLQVVSGIMNAPSILFGDGSVSAPSISFLNDSVSGFWRSGSGSVSLSLLGNRNYSFNTNGLFLLTNANSSITMGTSLDAVFSRTAAGSFLISGGAGNQSLNFNGTANTDIMLRDIGSQIISVLRGDGTNGASLAASGILPSSLIGWSGNGTPVIGFSSLSISSGFGTSPSITAPNGTAAFTVNVGTGGTATTGVINMGQNATTGWNCSVTNKTAAAGNRAAVLTVQTASTVNSVTVQNQTLSTGAATAWVASDILAFTCMGY